MQCEAVQVFGWTLNRKGKGRQQKQQHSEQARLGSIWQDVGRDCSRRQDIVNCPARRQEEVLSM
jgi:hypothetical protein